LLDSLLQEMSSRFVSSNDEYGFVRSNSFNSDEHTEFMQSYLRILSNRARKWEKLTRRSGYSKLDRSAKLKRYIRKGVPGAHRKEVWMEVSGANKLRREEPDLYTTMLAADLDPVVLGQIRTDMPRTFPNNVFFDTTNPNSMQKPLLNILKAFANNNPNIGYCQGLNYIAGLLLLVTKNEDSAFWLLKVMMESILPDYYSANMSGLLTDVKVLSEIARRDVPVLAGHIDALQVPWALIASKWFICLYSEVLPLETVLRIWDCLFNEGSKVLFRVALAILKLNEKNFLAKREFTDLMEEFKRYLTSAEVGSCHTFIEKVFQLTPTLTRARIEKLRHELGRQVRDEQLERDRRKNN